MASLESVQLKLYRAKKHYMELREELKVFFSNPESVRLAQSPEGDLFHVASKVPARFALIAGDFLQCLRTSLDYLVWELVLANGCEPTRQNAFPICSTAKNYEDELGQRKRLFGLSPEASAAIDLVQPFRCDNPKSSPLITLEKLTNINKHRRILLSGMKREVGNERELSFPHILSTVRLTEVGTSRRLADTFRFFVVINEDPEGEGVEICSLLESLSDFVGYEVLPLFQEFFKIT